MLGVIKVDGNSMEPTLYSGDFVLTTRLFRRLSVGDLVVCQHPQFGRIIKRIEAIDIDGRYLLKGDNPSSLTPERMGWLERSKMTAKVWLTITKK